MIKDIGIEGLNKTPLQLFNERKQAEIKQGPVHLADDDVLEFTHDGTFLGVVRTG
jgi:hypothetical protein